MSTMDVTLPIEHILNANPVWWREDTGGIAELADDMAKNGLKVPILVDSSYQVIDGSRRVQAAQKLGWESIHVLVGMDFWALHDALVSARKIGNADGWRKPMDMAGMMEIRHYLGQLYRPIAKARSSKAAGKAYPKALVKRGTNTMTDIGNALDIGVSRYEELGRIRSLLSKTEDPAEKRALREVLNNHAYGSPSTALDAMRKVVKKEETRQDPKRLNEQRNTLPRIINSLRGAMMALPEELDPGHDTAHLVQWEREVHELNTKIYRLRKQLREALGTNEETE